MIVMHDYKIVEKLAHKFASTKCFIWQKARSIFLKLGYQKNLSTFMKIFIRMLQGEI